MHEEVGEKNRTDKCNINTLLRQHLSAPKAHLEKERRERRKRTVGIRHRIPNQWHRKDHPTKRVFLRNTQEMGRGNRDYCMVELQTKHKDLGAN